MTFIQKLKFQHYDPKLNLIFFGINEIVKIKFLNNQTLPFEKLQEKFHM